MQYLIVDAKGRARVSDKPPTVGSGDYAYALGIPEPEPVLVGTIKLTRDDARLERE